VIEARIGRIAVVVDLAGFDQLVHAPLLAAVAVGHDAHVVVVDRAVADGDVVGLVDSHAGPVVAVVVGAAQLEAFQHAVVRARVELEDRPRRAASAAVVEAATVDLDPRRAGGGNGAERQPFLANVHGRLLVRLTAGAGMHQDHIAGPGLSVGVLDPRERLAGTDLQRRRRTGRGEQTPGQQHRRGRGARSAEAA